ncbi:co-chaperone GroES [Exiguobacterium sp. AM39-5BH]|uniref:co-chaperone GroES n=1 Tax=Exiguobacterium sp. AM39-5BH TaxID=2292355 RepID=UPI000FE25CF9|nr:co-chaperone GroES [Exiguobacterium sp. AM39-5BH]RHB46658.1 co-chaperone GroES [Exiguobacterium sp. AM39-5BH]
MFGGGFFYVKTTSDRVIIEVVEKEEKTIGGIVLPDTAKEKPQQGRVLAVGTGRVTDQGERIALDVKENDLVIYSKYAGTEVKHEGKEYLIVRESDILAIVG